MQHYNAPTRLLDWTDSPYVATYFAVKEKEYWNRDGAVWIVDKTALGDETEKKHEKFNDLSYFKYDQISIKKRFPDLCLRVVRQMISTDRMVAQQSIFTVCESPIHFHDSLIAEVMKNEGGRIRYQKVVIPHELKPGFLHKLIAMNVSANALFPGMDGVGRSIADMLNLEVIPEYSRFLNPQP